MSDSQGKRLNRRNSDLSHSQIFSDLPRATPPGLPRAPSLLRSNTPKMGPHLHHRQDPRIFTFQSRPSTPRTPSLQSPSTAVVELSPQEQADEKDLTQQYDVIKALHQKKIENLNDNHQAELTTQRL